ncbi:hypothetical protein TNCV_3269491 [Trichonephila clavipes]|nr:hypothetical protein TNCV_3269491 [Trichonephila clavipes]
MFSERNQCPWLKIEVAGGKNATEYYPVLLEDCGEKQLSYWKVARRVKAFLSSQNETADLQRTSRLSIPQDQIDILSGLISTEPR